MADHLDDIERVEQIKSWLARYATPMIIGIILGLAVIYGWQYWQKQQLNQSNQAAAMYQQISQAWVNASLSQKQTMASQLVAQYPKTVYADLASLGLASLAVQQQDYAKAGQLLDAVAHQGHDAGLRAIATIRLARVLAAQGDVDKGLALLSSDIPDSFTVLVDATRGDLYMLQHNQAAAVKAYQAALAANPHAGELLPLLPYQLQHIAIAGA